jgi:hypothetical protein
MTFTVEQKSQLAKLMATENLTVQHQKIQTAKFDPVGRILYLPIWQNMSGFMYDLLTGHEVGHALYTPADGWHDVASDKSKGKFYKNFLNVVEDARIEKKVQRKYPGLKTSFAKAYNELMNRDFFGIKGKEVNELPFIDRLNLFTKSQYTATWIEFNSDELAMIEKIKTLETWDDVLKLTGEIYDYSTEEQSEMHQEMYGDFDYEFGDDDYGDSDGEEFSDEYEETDQDVPQTKGSNSNDSDEPIDEENNGDGNGENTGKSSKSESDGEENNEDLDGLDSGKINRFKDSNPFDSEGKFQPRCETDETYRENETVLLDEKSKEYVYVDMPEPKMERIVTPWKRVQEQMTDYYKWECKEFSYRIDDSKIKSWVQEFKNKNDRYIGLLAKEFEMRKAAKAFSKSKLSDTGDIDINKLASYKFDDNIFRKVMLTPKGKNHGLILLLDKSGSMNDNMSGSIEQILVLTMFCRKVNIPFHVFGFGDASESVVADFKLDRHSKDVAQYYECFDRFEGALDLGSVRLREYLNSKMTNAEYSMAMRNMICLQKSFEGNRGYGRFHCGRPDCEELSNTPLTQAVVATAKLMKDFKTKNNLDMTSLVIVHDGDADYTSGYLKMEEYIDFQTEKKINRLRNKSFYTSNQNVILRDRKHKYETKLMAGKDNLIYDVLTWFQKTTGSKVFGFFLTGSTGSPMRSAIYNRYFFEDGSDFPTLRSKSYVDYDTKIKELVKQFKKEKFLITKPKGYSQFYLVAGGSELKTENDEIEDIEGKVTASKLKNAFMKFNKKKAVNRVLVSQFIQGIAA